MKVKALQAVGKIASKISNPSSLTSLYKSVQIGADKFQCCSEYGNLEIKLDPTGLGFDCLVNGDALLAISSSLPSEADITLEEKGNKITWNCGDAKGTLNQVVTDHKIPAITHMEFPWTPPDDFATGLLLASSACQAAAVSFGLYGIMVEPDGDSLKLMSSNTISLAVSKIEKGSYPFGKITVRPPVPSIIASLITACPGCKLDITAEGIFIQGDWLTAHLPLGVNLDHDLKELASKFVLNNVTAKVNSKAVKRFLSRAKQLSDKNASFNIGLRVENGRLALVHTGITSSTEEFFLADGLDPTINFESQSFAAEMILLPLEHIESIVFDYMPEQQLVMRGSKPDFLYVVGGA